MKHSWQVLRPVLAKGTHKVESKTSWANEKKNWLKGILKKIGVEISCIYIYIRITNTEDFGIQDINILNTTKWPKHSFSGGGVEPRVLQWLKGHEKNHEQLTTKKLTWLWKTFHEWRCIYFLLKMVDFPASHVSFREGCKAMPAIARWPRHRQSSNPVGCVAIAASSPPQRHSPWDVSRFSSGQVGGIKLFKEGRKIDV